MLNVWPLHMQTQVCAYMSGFVCLSPKGTNDSVRPVQVQALELFKGEQSYSCAKMAAE